MIGFDRRVGEGPVLDELLTIFNRQLPLALFGAVVIGAVTVFIMWDRVPDIWLLVWYGMLVLVTTLQMIEVIRYRRAPKDDQVPRRIWIMVGICVVSGANWGIGGMVFLDGTDSLITVYLVVLVTGMAAGSLAPLSPLPLTFIVISTFSILPMAIKLMTYGDTTLLVIGLLLFFSVPINIGYVKGFHHSLVETILLRFENDELIRQLTREKDRAEESELAKSRFLTAANHDLRQPLSALRLFVEALGSERNEVKASHLRTRISESAESLTMIIDGVLDLSRIEAGVEEVRTTDVAVDEVLKLIRNEFSAEAKSRGLELVVRPSLGMIRTDPELLLRIMRNLTSNALRYTVTGGVLVGCRRRGDQWVLEVWDTGIGIAAEQMKDIFREYFQVGNSQRDRDKGLGLGLSIVRALCDLMGTRIDVASKHGRGSVFRLALPSSTIVTLPQRRTPDEEMVVDTSRRILILDDTPLSLESIEKVVSGWGHQVTAISSVDQISGTISRGCCPDLFISDFRLPEGLTGLDAVAALFKVLVRPVPVLFVSGDTDPALHKMAAASGTTLQSKPLDPSALRAAINGLTRS